MNQTPLTIAWMVNGLEGHDLESFRSSLASTRYRGIIPSRHLATLGHTVHLMSHEAWLRVDRSSGYDVVVVGKWFMGIDSAPEQAFFEAYISSLDHARRSGSLVVADFCDDHFNHPTLGKPWRRLAAVADVCAASSATLRDAVSTYTCANVVTVGDPITSDAVPAHVYPAAQNLGALRWLGRKLVGEPPRPLRLLWYGSLSNWAPLRRWADDIAALRKDHAFVLQVMTTRAQEVLAYCAAYNDRCAPTGRTEFVDWSESGVHAALKEADVVLLPSDVTNSGKQVKSANRLTDALNSGCHVIASRLPSYLPFEQYVSLGEQPLPLLRRYLAHSGGHTALISQGAEYARRVAGLEAITSQWLELLGTRPASAANTHDRLESLGEFSPATDRLVAGGDFHQRVDIPPRPLVILVVALSAIPTVQLRFQRPFDQSEDARGVSIVLLTESELNRNIPQTATTATAHHWIDERIASVAPDIIVFCRYSGPYADLMLEICKHRDIASIFHLDDDLLHVPLDIGRAKHAFHNDPRRLANIRLLLNSVDLVQVASNALRSRLQAQGFLNRMTVLPVPCPHFLLQPAASLTAVTAADRSTTEIRIGYMGIDHDADLQLVLGALIDLLDNHPDTVLELFGPLALPEELEQFGARVRQFGPIANYLEFIHSLAARHWHIGICPLRPSGFNEAKTHIKWVEYSSVGAAVIASAGTLYDGCCDGGCGLLAADQHEWRNGLARLVTDHDLRQGLVGRAQERLVASYDLHAFRANLLKDFNDAMRMRKAARTAVPVPESPAQAVGALRLDARDRPSFDLLHQQHQGKVSDKWASYLQHYERVLREFRDQPIRLLEIGVQNGGSLEIWAKYFPQSVLLLGCDIDMRCAQLRFEDPRIHLIIGDATQAEVVVEVARQSAGYEVIIDDGSHTARDIIQSFLRYFGMLVPGGVFIAEDTHTMYMARYGGGLQATASAHEFFKLLVDLVNLEHWQDRNSASALFGPYLEPEAELPDFLMQGWVDRIEFANSMVFVHKALQPGHGKLGQRVISGQDAVVRPEVLRLKPSQEGPQ